MSETFEKISKVLDGDKAVHPAGGKPVVHRYQVVKMLSEDGNKIEYKPNGPWVVMADVHEIHVSRLQAENAALQQRLNVADQAIDELKNGAPVPPSAFDEDAERALYESQYVRDQQRGDSGRYTDPVVQHRFDGWIMCAKQRAGVV